MEQNWKNRTMWTGDNSDAEEMIQQFLWKAQNQP